MSKKIIGWLYTVFLIGGSLGLVTVITLIQGPRAWNVWNDPVGITLMLLGSLMLFLGVVLGFVSWIGALTNLSKVREWGWFLLLFFFGGIGLFLYLLVGPEPPPLEIAPQLSGLPYPSRNIFPPSPSQAPNLLPGQPLSALEILQQRYARGEIDTATFMQMHAQLVASNPPGL